MSTFWLKIIAITTMAIDHMGAIFFPQYIFLRIIGRIAFPLFAFLLVEGMVRTKSLEKYMLRMLLFAVITELPFDLAFWGLPFQWGHQNVMWTFFLALAAVYCYEKLPDKYRTALFFWGIALAFAGAATLLKTDYGGWGVIWVMNFYYYREKQLLKYVNACLLLLYYGLSYTLSYGMFFWQQYLQAFALLSFPFLLSYNGKKGPALKYLFYAFYPGHLLVFWLCARFWGGGF